jgi:hypothetical protein
MEDVEFLLLKMKMCVVSIPFLLYLMNGRRNERESEMLSAEHDKKTTAKENDIKHISGGRSELKHAM